MHAPVRQVQRAVRGAGCRGRLAKATHSDHGPPKLLARWGGDGQQLHVTAARITSCWCFRRQGCREALVEPRRLGRRGSRHKCWLFRQGAAVLLVWGAPALLQRWPFWLKPSVADGHARCFANGSMVLWDIGTPRINKPFLQRGARSRGAYSGSGRWRAHAQN